jgi:uncharacterized membrane protein YfcA
MRYAGAVLLGVIGLFVSYLALVHGSGDPIEFILVSAFVWLMCYDAWKGIFARQRRTIRVPMPLPVAVEPAAGIGYAAGGAGGATGSGASATRPGERPALKQALRMPPARRPVRTVKRTP